MKKLSIIIFAIAVALAVIFGIFAPNAEFNYLFGSVKYFSTSIIIAFLALILFFTSGNETRESKIYISPDGEFDIKTPRKYTPLRINSFSKFTGRANMFGQRNLKEFRYNDGIIFVENSKGESLEAPLSQLTFSYKKDKNKMNDEWYVYQYKLSDNNGNKVQFNYHSMLFNDEEYDDILMLLSLSSTVKEGKLSKATKIADSVLSSANSISDMDIIEAVGSAREAIKEGRQINMAQIGSETKERLLKKVKEQNGIIDEEEKKKGIKGFFKKVTEWGLIAIGILYIIAVIIVNVEPLFSSDSEPESDSTELYTVNSGSETQESAEPESAEAEDNMTATEITAPSTVTYTNYSGIIDGKYKIRMTLTSDGHGEYYYTKNGPDATLTLIITELEEDGKIKIEEYNDNGEQTGLFEGRMDNSGDIQGWFTNYKGKQMPFYLERINGD